MQSARKSDGNATGHGNGVPIRWVRLSLFLATEVERRSAAQGCGRALAGERAKLSQCVVSDRDVGQYNGMDQGDRHARWVGAYTVSVQLTGRSFST